MARPGGSARRARGPRSEAYRRYAYQVRMNYLRLFEVDIYSDLGLQKAAQAIRTNYRFGVLPMDAARGIYETERDQP